MSGTAARFSITPKATTAPHLRSANELVVGFVATVGNYDYVYKWVFREDGSFSFEAELNGLILKQNRRGNQLRDLRTPVSPRPRSLSGRR